MLNRLSHPYPRGRRTAVEKLNARVWFDIRRCTTWGSPPFALVVIDTPTHDGPLHRSTQLLQQINACPSRKRIHAITRRCDDGGHAPTAALLATDARRWT